jgi:uncharacterized protein (DUF1800 family)
MAEPTEFAARREPSPNSIVRSLAILAVASLVAAAPASAQTSADAAAHFLNQATFGPSPADVAAVQARGPEQWLAEQFQAAPSGVADGLTTSQLRAQVFWNMASGNDQLRQRMVFALSQIFVVSANKVGSTAELAPWMRLLTRNAFGNYRTLLREITLSPTMGKYLDLAYSRRATRTTSINENYAREMLQLFSIGLWELNQDGTIRDGGHPTYDQTTIREIARALTGWTFPTEPGQPQRSTNPQYFVGELEPRPANHDPDAKLLFGRVTIPAGQTPAADLEMVLDIVFTHPNVPPFIATRLIRSLVKSNPSPAYIRRVADVFRDNGQGVRGDLPSTLVAVLLDPEARAFNAADGRLKDPIVHVTGLGRALNAQFLDVNAFMGVFSNLSELVLTPTTVFSFYSPLAPLPGRADLFGPEFQIYPPALAIQRANFIYQLVTNRYSTAFSYDLTPFTALATNDGALVERVNQVLMQGAMSPALRQIIGAAVRAISPARTTDRAHTALYLAAISGEYAVYAPTDRTAAVPGSPAAPENVTGTASGSNLTLAWRNALSAGVPTSLMLDITGTLTASIPLGLAETFSYSGVPRGMYTFAVRAVNAAGASIQSNAVTLTFPSGACTSAPLTPTAFSLARTGNIVTVTWQPPATGAPPASYNVVVGGALAATFSTPALSLSGAAPPGTYMVRVEAVNACGTGPATASQTITVP